MSQRKLLLSAAVVDVELAKGVSSVQLVWPREKDGELSIGRSSVPIIAFDLDQIEEAQALLKKLVEVAAYETAQDTPVVAISDQNILLVEPGSTQKEVTEKRLKAGLVEGGDVVA